jgi:molecular chaperone DnaK (HSP70)
VHVGCAPKALPLTRTLPPPPPTHTLPLIQFLVGELAVDQLRVNPKNAVGALPSLLGLTHAEYLAAHGTPVFAVEDGPAGPAGPLRVSLQYRDEPLSATPELLTGLYLQTIGSFIQQSEGRAADVVALAVPPHYTPAQRVALLDAAKVAGLSSPATKVYLVSSVAAAVAAYGSKHRQALAAEQAPEVPLGTEWQR